MNDDSLRFGYVPPQPTIPELAVKWGLTSATIRARLKRGMTLPEALLTPLRQVLSRTRRAKREALAAGANKYEGKPCAHGHVVRYVKSDNCVECVTNRANTRRIKGKTKRVRPPTKAAQLRLDALARGDLKYEGTLCKRGHRVRYSSHGGCVECAADNALKYYQPTRKS